MTVKLVTCVMIQNIQTNEVLVQNRKGLYPGWSFPGGHIEASESFYDCAVREVKEETGLTVRDLAYCGVVHWVNRESDERYLCFLYKTTRYEGELVEENEEGQQFWLGLDALRATPAERFSSVHYALSPLFHEPGRYCEAFITWSAGEETWEAELK